MATPEVGQIRPKRKKHDILGIDCEMCQTTEGSELTRISIVDSKLMVIYDKLILPGNPIVDYLTQYSGITKEMMCDVDLTLDDMYDDMWQFMDSSTILVGHSLENDLRAMKLVHSRVIDTAVLFMNKKKGRKHGWKISLKKLSEKYLDKQIQSTGKKDSALGTMGHSSVEDATCAMQLAQLQVK